MRRVIHAVALGLGAALASQAVPAQAWAQHAIGFAALASPEAEELERQARALYDRPDEYGRAASLHLRAAEHRSAGDPMRTADLVQAARLYYYVGSKTKAFGIMRRAADEALSNGDVVSAAQALLDASSIAQELGRGEDVRTFAARAELLMKSPLVPDAERSRILTRLQQANLDRSI